MPLTCKGEQGKCPIAPIMRIEDENPAFAVCAKHLAVFLTRVAQNNASLRNTRFTHMP